MEILKRSEFHELLSEDISRDEFLANYWLKKPYLFKDRRGDRVRRLMGDMPHDQRILMWLSNMRQDADRYGIQFMLSAAHGSGMNRTVPVDTTPEQAFDAFSNGVRVGTTFFDAHRIDEGIMQLRTRLYEYAGMTASGDETVCGYIHSEAGVGVDLHFDEQPLFQLNLKGRRSWRVTPRPVCRSSRKPSFRSEDGLLRFVDEQGNPHQIDPTAIELEEIIMDPGDILYLPPCTPHTTKSLDDFSIGVSVFVSCLRYDQLVSKALADTNEGATPWATFVPAPDFARPDEFASTIANGLEQWAQHLTRDPSALIHHAIENLPRAAQFAPTVERPPSAPLSPQSRLLVPLELPVFLLERHPSGHIAKLRCNDQTLEFDDGPDSALAAAIFEGGIFSVNDIIGNDRSRLHAVMGQLQALSELSLVQVIA